MGREQLEKLITAQIQQGLTCSNNREVLAEPNHFDICVPVSKEQKRRVDLSQYTEKELMEMYFQNATTERAKEQMEDSRNAHEESLKIREKIRQAKEKAT